ncbi:MAG TPA: hypothetical protein VER78_05265 [Thermoanaerobaculia bacterium]|nr:hypothetical protein [Thermoanaerobaculia bacterium]
MSGVSGQVGAASASGSRDEPAPPAEKITRAPGADSERCAGTPADLALDLEEPQQTPAEKPEEKPPAKKPAASSDQSTAVTKSPPQERQTDSSRLSEEPIPLAKLPDRPRAPIDLGGDPFLGTGNVPRGFIAPGGAVVTPKFLTWGNLRTAVQGTELGNDTRRQAWANRLDLFSQLNFTATERIIASFRPFDRDGQFAGYDFAPQHQPVDNRFNAFVRTLYFEGDFGEIFPNLDPRDTKALDYGFAVGRFPVFFQEGMLLNDPMNAVGVVRNSLRPSASGANLRLSTVFSWGQVNRGGNQVKDTSAKLAGLFCEFDVPTSTVDIDAVYVNADKTTGSGVFGGISSVQRIFGGLNTTFRVLGSYALDQQTPSVGTGVLLYSAISFDPRGTEDIAYINAFGGFKSYTPAARDQGLGGPLTNVGILFESVGLGSGYGNVLPNQAKYSYGGVIGYQKFLGHSRRTQVILELGVRKGTKAPDNKVEGGVALRFQQAIGSHLIARLEGFAHPRESQSTQYGARYEFQLKF